MNRCKVEIQMSRKKERRVKLREQPEENKQETGEAKANSESKDQEKRQMPKS